MNDLEIIKTILNTAKIEYTLTHGRDEKTYITIGEEYNICNTRIMFKSDGALEDISSL